MSGTQYWGTGLLGATLATSFTTAAGTAVSGFSKGTQKARVIVTNSAYLNFGSTSGTTGGAYFPANVPEYVTVRSTGFFIGVISSVTATTGFIFVTEAS